MSQEPFENRRLIDPINRLVNNRIHSDDSKEDVTESGQIQTLKTASEFVEKKLKYFLKNVNVKVGNYAANDAYWKMDGAYPLLKPGISKYEAIHDMVNPVNKMKYYFDCSNLSYFARLYAVSELIDTKFGDGHFDALLNEEELTFWHDDHYKGNYLETLFRFENVQRNIKTPPVGTNITLTSMGKLTVLKGSFGLARHEDIEIPLNDPWNPDTQIVDKNSGYLNEHVLKVSESEYFAFSLTHPRDKSGRLKHDITELYSFEDVLRAYAGQVLRDIEKEIKVKGQHITSKRKFKEFQGFDAIKDVELRIEKKIEYIKNNHIKISELIVIQALYRK